MRKTNVKKLLLFVVIVALMTVLFCVSASAKTYRGTCGSNLTWSLDTETGELVIEGTGAMKSYGSFSSAPWYSNCSYIKTVTIGDSVTSIGSYAFYDCTGLTSVTIGDSVTSIGSCAFKYCSGLTSVTIPDSVTSIGEDAFMWCKGLTSVTIGNSVESIGSSTFYGCYKLVEVYNRSNLSITAGSSSNGYVAYYAKNVYTPTSGQSKLVTKDDYVFYNDGGKYYLMGYTGTDTNLVLPADINGEGYEIYQYAFYERDDITSVTIPDSVTSIGGSAFEYCSGLTSVTILSKDVTIYDSSYTIPSATVICGIEGSSAQAYAEEYGRTFVVYRCAEDSHTWDEGVVTQEPTIFVAGQKTFTCTICNETRVEILPTAEYSYSGTCGEALEWGITADGEMRILGTGDMADYGYGEAPWYDYGTSIKTITVGNGVTSIGASAFCDCPALTSVTLGADVTSIGDYAFDSCPALASITVPDSVMSLGECAFYGCSGLTSLTLGKGVKNIEYRAFYGCTGLTEVTIPENVTTIGRGAFYGCSKLALMTVLSKTVEIYDNASTLPTATTLFCSSGSTAEAYANKYNRSVETYITSGLCGSDLTWFLMSDGELAISGEGEMGKWNSSANVPWNAYRSSIKKITIGDDVTSIGNYAFYGCSDLISVTIGKSVTSIGSYAFEDCTSLTSVTIGDSVTSIGEGAFYNCSGLTSVTIGDSVTSIGEGAFYNCSGLTSVTIPDSVTSIGSSAFRGCTGFTSVTIPDSVTSIGSSAFCECTGLTSVTLGDSVTSIGSSAFAGCTGLTSVTLGDSVTSIGDYAFFACAGLTSVTIPDSVTSIGSSAFYGCTGLTSVTIGDSVATIGGSAFYGCTGLTSVTIPDSVTSIGSAAFGGCSSLESITIPFVGDSRKADSETPLPFGYIFGVSDYSGGVATEQYYKKSSTTSLTYTTYYIPATLKSVTVTGHLISSGAFYNCTGLTSITIGNGVTSIHPSAFRNCTGLTSIIIPDSVTFIGNSAFSECINLASITIGNGVTSIGNYAFYGCSSLTSITIPDSVTSIGDYAFEDCTGLTSVTIPDSVTSIGSYAFRGCNGLTAVHITDLAAWCKISFSGSYSNPLYYAKNLYLDGELVTDLVIPDSVTTITSWAFYNCSSLTSVTIPDSVTSIGYGAFEDCTGLTSVTIPDSVTSIGSSAFYNCTGLTSVTIGDSVTSIGYDAFYGCSKLTAVHITDLAAWCKISFSSSYSNPLSYAKKLYLDGELVTELVIPNGITKINSCAFWNCIGLTSVTIPDSVTSIGSSAFYDCDGLTSVTIPDSVTSIGDWAFAYCSALASITIPDSVTSIGDSAFRKLLDPVLNSITFVSATTELYDDAYTISDTATICGFAGSTAAAYAEKYSRTFIPFAIDCTTVFELTATFVADAEKAGQYLPVATFVRSDEYSSEDFVFLYVEGATGKLYVGGVNGSYIALLDEEGEALMLDSDETDIVVIYDDNDGEIRYHIGGVIPTLGRGRVLDCTIHDMTAVTDSVTTLDGVHVKNIYNINASETADFVGFQVNTADSTSIRILAGLDMLYYDSTGFEIELYSNDILQGSVLVNTRTVFSGIKANGVTVTAESLGYRYLVALDINGIDRTDYPYDAEVCFVVKPYTEVDGDKCYGESKTIMITYDAEKGVHRYLYTSCYNGSHVSSKEISSMIVRDGIVYYACSACGQAAEAVPFETCLALTFDGATVEEEFNALGLSDMLTLVNVNGAAQIKEVDGKSVMYFKTAKPLWIDVDPSFLNDATCYKVSFDYCVNKSVTSGSQISLFGATPGAANGSGAQAFNNIAKYDRSTGWLKHGDTKNTTQYFEVTTGQFYHIDILVNNVGTTGAAYLFVDGEYICTVNGYAMNEENGAKYGGNLSFRIGEDGNTHDPLYDNLTISVVR